MLGSPIEEWRRVAPPRERSRETVEEQLRYLADREQIRALIDEYGICCDTGSWDRLGELYDENIERRLAGTLSEVVRGRENLIDAHQNPALPRAEGIDTRKIDVRTFRDREVRHLISTRMIRIADDDQTAWAFCYYQMAVSGRADSGWKRGEHEGTYVFTFSRESGAWKFTRHLVYSNNALNPMFARPPQDAR